MLLVACLALTAVTLGAHDAGLSALDLRVGARAIDADLSIAAPDVALLAKGGDADTVLRSLASDGIHVSADGEPLRPAIDGVAFDKGAARVRLSFAMAAAGGRGRRLVIASDVPRHLARGHRHFVTVTAGGRIVIERLLEAQSGPVTLDVDATPRPAAEVAWNFLGLGVHHILSGYDHLVFLAGLLLAAKTRRELITAVTAFTAAHSLSLVLVVIGGVHAPPSLVEPLIAASIAWVGLENLLRRGHGARAAVVFGFGVIHGFGFAGALMDLRATSSGMEIALALGSFNLGVEAGQLAASAVLLPLFWAIKSRPRWQARLTPVCSTMILLAGAYWLIARLT